MKRVAIIQLARLGDIIQSLPTIQGLKRADPETEITLIVRKTFADAARVSPHIDHLIEIDMKEILGSYFEDQTSEAKTESFFKLKSRIRELQQTHYDHIINLTFSSASSYLASLLKGDRIVGMRRDTDGAYIAADPWSQYFFAQILERNLNILHLNDVFARIAGITENLWPLDLCDTAVELPTLSEGLKLGIQVTASQVEKMPNLNSWIRICRKVLELQPKATLYFFGAAHDAIIIDEIRNALGAERTISLAGRFRFHENLAALRRMDHVVSPDTALVHLASAAGIHVIELALGNVRPEETGPYGIGHHVIYPINCSSDELGEIICDLINGKTNTKKAAIARTDVVRCTNGSRRNVLKPENFTPDEVTNFFSQAYYLLAEFRNDGRQEDIEIPEIGHSSDPKDIDRLVLAFDAMCSLRKTAEFGQFYCLQMIENIESRELLQENMAKLAELEVLLENLKKTVPFVKPLIDTWRVRKDVAPAPNGLLELLGIAEGSYRELSQNVDIVQQLLQVAVDRAKQAQQKVSPSPLKEKADSV